MKGDITEATIKKFVFTQSLPLVVEFNHETAQKIFGGDIKSHLLFMLSKNSGHFDLIEPIKEVAKEFREQVRIIDVLNDYLLNWGIRCVTVTIFFSTGFVCYHKLGR